MKLKKNSVAHALLVVAALAAVIIGGARALGCDLFDRSGWSVEADGSRRYLDYYGEAVSGWQEIDGTAYYFSPENGAMATGWLELAGEKLFLDADGQKTVGWTELDGKRYYFDASGVMRTGWLQLAEGTYYLDDDGAAYSGWLDSGESRYYIASDGSIMTGWLEEGGKRFFFDESGRMHTGWLETDEGKYYLRQDGTIAVGKQEIDGTTRYFTSTGKHFVLVNRWNPVPEDYTVTLAELDGFQMAEESCEPLARLLAACNEAGYPCKIRSGYRSFNFQTTAFEKKVNRLMGEGYSREAAERETSYSIAIPGTSEHQLGLAVDFSCGQGAYKWLAEHSWEYGFIMRYPFGKSALTGIYYEPWHYRYVGTELAKEIYDLGLCVEEYMDMLTEQAK